MEQPSIPDLASILQTLKAYAPPPTTAPTPNPPSPDLEDGEYDPSQSILPPPPPPPSNPPSSSTTPKPPPSATHITTYPPALTHTINHIFPSPPLRHRIAHLIATQHAHERSWWAARQDLIRKAKGRDRARRELEGVLASVRGGAGAMTLKGQGGEGEDVELERELAVFDAKVYRAWREMRDAAGRELGEMGVPFFCLGKGVIGGVEMEEGELEGLRGRILVLLEDYCGGGEGGGKDEWG